MARICHLASGHYPDDDRIFYKEARSLARGGHEVIVIAPRREGIPAEKDGVRFDLVSENRGHLGRLRNLFRIYRAARRWQPQLCHCHEPDSLLVGVWLKRQLGCRLVFDSHELWPGVVARRLPRLLARPAAWLYAQFERALLRRCDAAIGATPAITARLAGSVGEDRTRTLLNVPAVEVFAPPAGAPPEDVFVVCHDGALTFDRGLRVMAAAARLLAEKHRVVFRIVGDVFGPERDWLEAFVREHCLEAVIQRTGWLPYEQVGDALARCHLGLVAFTRKPNHVIAAPNKIFNYLLYGLPFIGPDFMVEVQRMAREDGCCVPADCASPAGLACAIEALVLDRAQYRRLAENARRASAEKYRWQFMEPELLDLYRQVLAAPAR